MSEADNKEIRRRFWAEQFSATDTAVERYLAGDVIDHDAAPDQPAGAEGFRWLFQRLKAGFPDIRAIPVDMIAEGDKVATRWVIEGTNTESYQGMPPTGKRISVEGIQIDRFVDGKIVESWNHSSSPGVRSQLAE